jgi:hypothetical protein|tara:strand:- start:179 stop:520 length:342 start_codon:yes stop_codon:yes gene_type:complete
MSETVYTIDHAKLNKCEIDILHFIESWLPTFTSWSVKELGEKCNLFTDEVTQAVDMLILHGLLDNADDDALVGRMVSIPDEAVKWLHANMETINSLHLMNDSDMFDETEIAEA